MEERVAPSAEDPQSQLSRPEPNTSTNSADDDDGLTLQLARPPLETYVVQVPKDQIYRVPPPENALIVQNYRQAAGPAKNRKRPCLKYLIWIAVVLVVFGVIIGVALNILYNSFTPKAPVFSVSTIHAKKITGHPANYDVTLKVHNPNEKMGIKYGSVGDGAKLIFSTKTLGAGQFRRLYQNRGDSNVVHVKLVGPADQALPPDIQSSMTDKRPKHQISLALKFKSPFLLNVWVFKMWSRDMDVECEFRVNTLGKGAKILSQECNTNLS